MMKRTTKIYPFKELQEPFKVQGYYNPNNMSDYMTLLHLGYQIPFADPNFYVPILFENVRPIYSINCYGTIINTNTGYIVGNRINTNGYIETTLYTTNDTPRNFKVHRLVAAMFCPNPYNKPIVNHIDGNKSNCFYRNLEWTTYSENTLHAFQSGLNTIPERDLTSRKVSRVGLKPTKMKPEDIHNICAMMQANKYTYSEILEMCGLEVNPRTLDILARIKSKKLWKSISDKYNIGEKRQRTKQVAYSDDQIHTICKMIQDGKSNREISIYLNIDMKDKKCSDKFFKFIMRIRRRESYTHISDQYNW